MTHTNIVGIFVYGTLKRGQCRERCWPLPPQAVQEAWIRGSLFGRADYPALRAGADRVLGELWQFADDEFATILDVLDQVEQTSQPGLPDLYVRVVAPVWSTDDHLVGNAVTYQYATNPVDDGFHRLKPQEGGWVSWGAP